MTREMASILTTGLGLAEIGAYSLAALGVFRHWGYTLAEAAAGAAFMPVMLVSFLLQVVCLTGFPELIFPLRLSFLAVAVGLIWRHRGMLHGVGVPLWRFYREQPLAVGVLGLTLGSLAGVGVLSGWQGGHFQPLHFETPVALSDCTSSPLKAPMGEGVVVANLPGAVLLPWTAYLSVCLATYALARRYAWPPTAITVTLLVASMPRLVFLSVSRSLEIIPAAAALLSILLLYRTVERPAVRDFLLLAVLLAFGISGDRMYLVFTIISFGLAATVLYRRHGGRIWWDLLRASPFPVAIAVLPVGIFACVGFGVDAAAPWAYNADGIRGASANIFRYGLQMLDLTPPVDHALHKTLGLDWLGFRSWVHDYLLAAVFHSKGLGASFSLAVSGDRALAWFGPFAGLLFMPALGWALMRGPRRLKSLSLALMGYFFLMALIPAWMPGNVRYFTVFFVCSGFTTAFLLPPWRMTRRRRRFFQLSALALMVYAVGAVFHSL